MDRITLQAIQRAARHADLEAKKAFFDGVVVGLLAAADADDEGRMNEDWKRDVRDHVALYKEYSA